MFERFTPAARMVVVQAQQEARRLDHGYIGTEHLLLALLSEGDPPITEPLAANHIDHRGVERLLLEIVGRGEGAPHGHIPFTPRAKKVLELSLREALKLGHKNLAPAHILLGLLREGNGVAAQILTKLGADLSNLREDVLLRIPPSGRKAKAFRGIRVPAPMAMTTAGARAASRAIARAAGGPVGSQHYLLGALDDEHGLAARALFELGVDRAAIEAKLAELSAEGTSDESPEQVGARQTSLQLLGNTVAVQIEEADLAARLRPYFDLLRLEVLRGAELPGAERLWKAVRPALEHVARNLERARTAPNWSPPGVTKAGLALYTVTSRPGGPTGDLWTAEGADEKAIRRILAQWLAHQPPASPGSVDCVFFTVAVARAGDIVPNAADPDAPYVSHWSSGPGPAPADWPRVPLADLVAFALDDLS